jgi:hypothetical protein
VIEIDTRKQVQFAKFRFHGVEAETSAEEEHEQPGGRERPDDRGDAGVTQVGFWGALPAGILLTFFFAGAGASSRSWS